ncbi:MAG: cardiolipin synthase [Proteobacteria bacterium]|nr:MAG: cardiolipin synthase [Pseudomonadota bacterium]
MMALLYITVQILGLITAVFALLSTRTSQGTIAWVVTLIAFPWLGVPAYLIFGRTRFRGHISARIKDEKGLREQLGLDWQDIQPLLSPRPQPHENLKTFEVLAKLAFTQGNAVELLINGQRTFDSIFDGIRHAHEYLLVQFYIVRDDVLGRQLKQLLCDAASRGVRVYFLFDDIGSYTLSNSYLDSLTEAGVMVYSFHSSSRRQKRFQINFRNHRKIVIADGKVAWIGGHNVGDEYLGNTSPYDSWRDTHIRLAGPAVLGAQLSFIEDWHWVTDSIPTLNWSPCAPSHATQRVLILPSGPSDPFETASLMMQHAIHIAEKRIWIATPYFVPDEGVQQALRLAAIRGIDVRIIIPEKMDNWLTYLSVFSFMPGILKAGVKVMQYQAGFLHQKVFLVDDYLSAVGTVNMNNRSFRLNFEITALIDDKNLAADIEAMLLNDFHHSTEMSTADIEAKPLWFKILSRAAYLSAPIQ